MPREDYPMFQRFFDEGLAQSSFLLACPRTRQAAVIDPRRDVDAYVEAARRRALRIEWAIETHIHADIGLVTVVDVRTRNEWEQGHLEGSLSIPAGEIASRVDEIPRSRPVALICESGQRSALAASLLERAGFSDVANVGGGMTLVRQCL